MLKLVQKLFGFNKNKNTKVYVAMSGGVDSSVAAALLQQDGYDVVGVYFKAYQPSGDYSHCKNERDDAEKVCKKLGIPFKTFDLKEQYKHKVFEYMLNEYKRGNTPNPDIMCNKHIKFGEFFNRAIQDGTDLIATGHYARVKKTRRGAQLYKAVDTDKDQSYFLSQVSQTALSKTIFPLGKLRKSKVRKLAKKFDLHTSAKKDSQGICFIGREINVKDFLKAHIQAQNGDVLSTNDKVIGKHSGAVFYTTGERHDFTIFPEFQTPDMPRLFVIAKNIANNTITVGTSAELKIAQRSKNEIKLKDINYINEEPQAGKSYQCRIRHRGTLHKCTVNGDTVIFQNAPYSASPGQFLAIYDGNECLGGGEML